MQADLLFSSRRSPVVCLNGCVSSSQPLASNIGLEILKRGGNAADAAVAVAAALNVTEPTSTGIGGDAFCLFYDAATKQVRGLNGSGRSPKAQTLELMERCGFSQSNPPHDFHALNVTVPGAAACWCDTVTLFGSKKLSLADLLQPAIDLAQNGFPVAEITAYQWAKGAESLRAAGRELGRDLLINNQPPKHGQVMTNPNLARTFQELVLCGRTGFYEGRIAQAVVDVVQENGGVMSLDDMKNHVTTEITPIYINYKTVRVWEVPPNSQGMAALIALNILENVPIKDLGHNSAHYLHILVESLKLSMTDTMHFSTDPDKVNVPVEGLLSKDYALQRAKLIQMDKARSVCDHGIPAGSDTVYFTVVDGEGNACSFVNSNYMGFGTGLVPRNCGFSLQNRGANFSLDSTHVNCIGPEKRPYHTIIPAMLTDPLSGRLLCSFGVMGGFMQPQGHVQVLLNMLEFGMNPQRALDAPRVFVQFDQAAQLWQLNLEAGMDRGVADELRGRGHVVNWPVEGHERDRFGRGQIISVGFALIPLAICSIVANVLLIFPDGEEDLSKYMSSFTEIGGGGITTFIAAFAFLSMAKCADSCGNENYAMYGSMLAALIGLTGSGYSFIISAMPMLELHCLINSNWAKYLFARESWSNCEQPAHNAEWNVTLLSIQLVLSLIEFLICSVQFISGLVRTIRKPCSILSV